MKLRMPLLCLLAFTCACIVRGQPCEDTTQTKSGKFLAIPLVKYSPETRLAFGAVAVYYFRPKGAAPKTRLSSLRIPITYTINQQYKFKLSHEIVLDNNRHIFLGEAAWSRFPLSFYGIGPTAAAADQELYTTQTLLFQWQYLVRMGRGVFVGLSYEGIRSNIEQVQENHGVLRVDGFIPGNTGSFVSGIGAAFRFDKRANVLNPVRGPLIEGRIQTYQNWLGSEYYFTRLAFDFRHYAKLFGRHVLGAQVYAQQIWGDPPFEQMALMGGDEIMRGHMEGRYRDKALLAGQLEYRIPIGRRGWFAGEEKLKAWQRFGLVGFVGIGNVSSSLKNVSVNHLKHSTGLGLRYMVSQKEQVNVRFDVAFGTQNPGFYLGISEAF